MFNNTTMSNRSKIGMQSNKIFNSDDDIRIEKNEKGEDVYILDPYNPLNKEITENDIQQILRSYGIDVKINNFTLYKRAFIHRSYIKRPSIENQQNNITDYAGLTAYRITINVFNRCSLRVGDWDKYRSHNK